MPLAFTLFTLFLGSVYLCRTLLKEGWRKYLQPVVIAVSLLCYLFQFIMLLFQIEVQNTLSSIQKTTKLGMLRWEDGKKRV